MRNTYRSCCLSAGIFLFVSLTGAISAAGQPSTEGVQKKQGPVKRDQDLILSKDRVDPAIEGGLTLTLRDDVIKKTDLGLIRVTIDDVKVARSDDLPKLLESSGIKWSPRSIGLIYDLNPGLADVRDVPEQSILVLPRITGDSVLEQLKAIGPIAKLSSKYQQPNKMARVTQKTLRELSDLLYRIPLINFRRPKVKTNLIKLINSAVQSLNFLSGDKSSASREIVTQSTNDAMRLHEMVLDGLSAKRVGDPAIQAEALEISHAVASRVEEIKAGRSALVEVEVRTVTKRDGKPVPGLRVFYRPIYDAEGKYTKKFGNPTTPSKEPLPFNAKFILWGGDGDDPKPLTDQLEIQVGTKTPPVTLIVKD